MVKRDTSGPKTMKQSKPNVIQYRIRFCRGDDKSYAKVFIFPDKDTMLGFYELQCAKYKLREKGLTGSDDFEAMFQPFQILNINADGTETWNNWIGNFLFYRGGFGVGAVAHECFHAAIRWFQIKNGIKGTKTIIKSGDDEESVADVVGRLAARFWEGWHKRIKEIKKL